MTTPTPAQLKAALTNGRGLQPLAETFAEKIFTEILQGDEFIDAVEDLQARWDFLSLDDPDEDVRTNCRMIDEVWNRIIMLLLDKMQATRRHD